MIQTLGNFFRISWGTDVRTRLALAGHSFRWHKVPAAQAGHDVGRRLAVKGGGTRHRDESLIRHSRGGKHNTLISFSLDAAGPAVEEGPRMISLSSSLDAAASARPSVMEVTRQQRFLNNFDEQAQLPRAGCWHQCLNSNLSWGSRAAVYCE